MKITDMNLDDLKRQDMMVYAMILSDVPDDFADEYIKRKYDISLKSATEAYSRLKEEYAQLASAEEIPGTPE